MKILIVFLAGAFLIACPMILVFTVIYLLSGHKLGDIIPLGHYPGDREVRLHKIVVGTMIWGSIFGAFELSSLWYNSTLLPLFDRLSTLFE
jgi:hypothetical protein